MQRKWTSHSTDCKVKNEIDFILSNFKNIAKDVTVLNSVNTGSDHRLVRVRIEVNKKFNKRKLLTQDKLPNTEALDMNQEEYQSKLKKRLGPLPVFNTKDITGFTWKNNTFIGKTTLDLMKVRRRTSKESPEYKAINNKVKKSIKSELRAYQTKQILQTIENNKNRVLKSNLTKGKSKITKITNQQGNTVMKKTQIIKEIQTFYENLYTSTIQNPGTEQF
ncbi:uncharacterized protein [Diabrotica undecimpunctata]|uniref:uncharacterized protein n=1 Tax=Diabrotica undecimpunctata TaxID=50387 RepID=UPI003B6406FA